LNELTMKNVIIYFVFIFLTNFFYGCYPALRQQAEKPREALVPVSFFYPQFEDDLNYSSLAAAIKRNLAYLDKLKPGYTFDYGPHQFTCDQVRESQKIFLKMIREMLQSLLTW